MNSKAEGYAKQIKLEIPFIKKKRCFIISNLNSEFVSRMYIMT